MRASSYIYILPDSARTTFVHGSATERNGEPPRWGSDWYIQGDIGAQSLCIHEVSDKLERLHVIVEEPLLQRNRTLTLKNDKTVFDYRGTPRQTTIPYFRPFICLISSGTSTDSRQLFIIFGFKIHSVWPSTLKLVTLFLAFQVIFTPSSFYKIPRILNNREKIASRGWSSY